MKIEEQKELVSGFQHLELLANQVVEGFISGMHKSPRAKALNISIGNYLPKQIGYTPKNMKKKPIFVAI
jgi:hypothetical protein